jgi:hypothetical protein
MPALSRITAVQKKMIQNESSMENICNIQNINTVSKTLGIFEQFNCFA